jgi:DNA-binding CsgD family transcriptional regulator
MKTKIKRTWEAVQKIWGKGKPQVPSIKRKCHFTTPKSQRAKELLLSRNYNDTQIADMVGLSRERIRQYRAALNLGVTHETCSAIIDENTLTEVVRLAHTHTLKQIATKLDINRETLKKTCDKYEIKVVGRAWKIHPDRFKAKMETCGYIIRDAARQLGISYMCALRYTRALGLKSKYNKKPLDKSSKYDPIRDEVIGELRSGKPLKIICEERGISEAGFRNHLMYKGVTIKEILAGKEPRDDY